MSSSEDDYINGLRKAAMERVVHDLVKEKICGSNGRAQRDSYQSKIKALQAMGVSITKDALWKRVERQYKRTQQPDDASSLSSPSSISDSSTLSSLTDPTFAVIGRPKGTTSVKKREDKDILKQCLNAIAYDYATKLTSCKAEKKRCKKGFLDELIEAKKAEFQVVGKISASTIRNRVRSGNLKPDHSGTSSPLQQAELAMVDVCIQMGNIRQPLVAVEAVCVFNDLIKDTPIQKALTEFKLARRTKKAREQDANQCGDMDVDAFGSVGLPWHRAFMRRHSEKLYRNGARNLHPFVLIGQSCPISSKCSM